jgi:hypothetical protein
MTLPEDGPRHEPKLAADIKPSQCNSQCCNLFIFELFAVLTIKLPNNLYSVFTAFASKVTCLTAPNKALCLSL